MSDPAKLETALTSMSRYISTQVQSMASHYDNAEYDIPAEEMTAEEKTICRDFYLAVLAKYWTPYETAIAWKGTQRQFDQLLDQTESELESLPLPSSQFERPEEITLLVDEMDYTIPLEDLKRKSIGRIQFTDLPLKQECTNTSRLHAIVHAFPEHNLIAVIDLGSYAGIKMLERSNQEAPLAESLPNDRRPLLIALNETAVFQLGDQRLVINPKRCIICDDAYRNFVGNCGHFICCQSCADTWLRRSSKCPTCNQEFAGPQARPNSIGHVQTMCANLGQ